MDFHARAASGVIVQRLTNMMPTVPTFIFTRDSGEELSVSAKKSRGESGSLSAPDCVEVLAIEDANGRAVETTPEEDAAIQSEAEKALS